MYKILGVYTVIRYYRNTGIKAKNREPVIAPSNWRYIVCLWNSIILVRTWGLQSRGSTANTAHRAPSLTSVVSHTSPQTCHILGLLQHAYLLCKCTQFHSTSTAKKTYLQLPTYFLMKELFDSQKTEHFGIKLSIGNQYLVFCEKIQFQIVLN